MVVINFAIIITDSHRGSPCYGIMSNSSYRWINRSSVRISGFSKITELISDGDKIWTPVCPAPNSDSIFLTPLGGSRWCLHQHCSQELTDMCSPRVQGTCYYSSSPPPIQRDTAKGSRQPEYIKSKVRLTLQVWAYSPEPFYPLEEAWKAPGFILKIPPSNWPTSQPNRCSLTENFLPPKLLIKLWRKLRLGIQIIKT